MATAFSATIAYSKAETVSLRWEKNASILCSSWTNRPHNDVRPFIAVVWWLYRPTLCFKTAWCRTFMKTLWILVNLDYLKYTVYIFGTLRHCFNDRSLHIVTLIAQNVLLWLVCRLSANFEW